MPTNTEMRTHTGPVGQTGDTKDSSVTMVDTGTQTEGHTVDIATVVQYEKLLDGLKPLFAQHNKAYNSDSVEGQGVIVPDRVLPSNLFRLQSKPTAPDNREGQQTIETRTKPVPPKRLIKLGTAENTPGPVRESSDNKGNHQTIITQTTPKPPPLPPKPPPLPPKPPPLPPKPPPLPPKPSLLGDSDGPVIVTEEPKPKEKGNALRQAMKNAWKALKRFGTILAAPFKLIGGSIAQSLVARANRKNLAIGDNNAGHPVGETAENWGQKIKNALFGRSDYRLHKHIKDGNTDNGENT